MVERGSVGSKMDGLKGEGIVLPQRWGTQFAGGRMQLMTGHAVTWLSCVGLVSGRLLATGFLFELAFASGEGVANRYVNRGVVAGDRDRSTFNAKFD